MTLSPAGPKERLGQRVFGAVVFVVVMLGTLLWGPLPFALAITAAAAVGSVELFSMFEAKGSAIPTAAVVGILGSVAYVLLAHFKGLASYGYVTVGLLFVSFMWYMLVLRHVKPTRAVAVTVLAPLLAGLCLSHLVLLNDLLDKTYPPNRGWLLVLFFLAMIWIYDVLAWAVGRKLGRHKIAPTISPNKSWEGAIAGAVGIFGAAVVGRWIIQLSLGNNRWEWFSIGVALAIAAIVCVLGPLGDLSESLMKRDFGVKDMGKLIPGHGGIMDRLDSTLFTAPAVFYLFFYFVL
jgi:phosphatidate cytidylyltransferase